MEPSTITNFLVPSVPEIIRPALSITLSFVTCPWITFYLMWHIETSHKCRIRFVLAECCWRAADTKSNQLCCNCILIRFPVFAIKVTCPVSKCVYLSYVWECVEGFLTSWTVQKNKRPIGFCHCCERHRKSLAWTRVKKWMLRRVWQNCWWKS